MKTIETIAIVVFISFIIPNSIVCASLIISYLKVQNMITTEASHLAVSNFGNFRGNWEFGF
jgi:hypothetical protein